MRAVVEAGKGLVTPRLLVAKAAKSKQAAMDLAHVLVARPFHRRKAAWVERFAALVKLGGSCEPCS